MFENLEYFMRLYDQCTNEELYSKINNLSNLLREYRLATILADSENKSELVKSLNIHIEELELRFCAARGIHKIRNIQESYAR